MKVTGQQTLSSLGAGSSSFPRLSFFPPFLGALLGAFLDAADDDDDDDEDTGRVSGVRVTVSIARSSACACKHQNVCSNSMWLRHQSLLCVLPVSAPAHAWVWVLRPSALLLLVCLLCFVSSRCSSHFCGNSVMFGVCWFVYTKHMQEDVSTTRVFNEHSMDLHLSDPVPDVRSHLFLSEDGPIMGILQPRLSGMQAGVGFQMGEGGVGCGEEGGGGGWVWVGGCLGGGRVWIESV